MESRILYKALRERNVPVELEVFDGHKTIDLVVKSLKINIEVDGVHHNANSKQASSDLIRTLCSYRKGYITFRIPNSIIHNSLEETADRIVDILLEAKNRKDERDSSFKDLPEKEYNHKKFSFFRVLEGIYKRIF
ncbi:DUF559 domain-containing protein [Parabacteroides bouchesdurhonensis]|uniref:DUF559 domain-containing protein n=1 Tax=Parabacteroides bouchesdurhonensis TaxID=1936995 RepID=UPI001C9D3D10|nr:DUF559 domain-containing protein [Parabacteroides bouchesdurhonensis]